MSNRDWTSHKNSRGLWYKRCERKHVRLEYLKEDPSLDNGYLQRTPSSPYPKSVLFKAKNLCHETALSGLQGICDSSGFQAFHENLLWWRPFITKGAIAGAESRWLDSLSTRVSPNQEPILEKFTTSPAFQEKSRYGNFRFKFTVKELLRLYSEQFCYNRAPILRVLDTRVYKQEIMYTILVHPRYITQYKKYPRLPFSSHSLCGYNGCYGKLSWRCQAPSKEYDHRLEVEDEVYATPLRDAEYFVWDHVSVAFHMEEDWTLEVNRRKLMNRVSVCEVDPVNILRNPDKPLSVSKATDILEDLKRRMDEDY